MLTLFWHPQWAAGEGEEEPELFPPVADFTATPLSGSNPLEATFTDASTNTPTSWLWDFGDSATSTLQNPTHTYTAAGSYTVTLTATNADGSDVEVKVNYINVVDPVTPSGNTDERRRRAVGLFKRGGR